MPVGTSRIIEYNEPETISAYEKIDCSDINNLQTPWISIITCKNQTSGELVIPSKSYNLDVCGYCFWEYNSDKLTRRYDSSDRNVNIATYSHVVLSTEIKTSAKDSPDLVECKESGRLIPLDMKYVNVLENR